MRFIDFKMCLVCLKSWGKREEFLADENLTLVGYQANFMSPGKGLFFFNHSCNGTLSVPVETFADLYDGPIFAERKTGTHSCPSFCLHENDLRPCPEKCECAYVREILQLLARPKNAQKDPLPEQQ